ncbi:LD-carboxypeptidase [Spirosoma sp. BT702]|uniref:LD-carboxypeptidase n=1 Tax=Spirosoma profusum TaxID=2771354 RepID=A0A926XVQ1_9BACT|nr:S66 peptidase family protein [Spirosoma profusum]MBD2701244.1 LD-carboxypeptidase [Spirosoma profusum]
MNNGLTKPKSLQPGDTVATISLSWGGAATFPHRYEVGKSQLEQTFGLRVVETRNALRPADWLYRNPQARADDLMEAFADPQIKAIISIIGGDDSIRTLPFLDVTVIRDNPKIFLGFSDTTVTHLACYRAGLSSFYGTSLLVGFAENGSMHAYQVADLRRTLFASKPTGVIEPNKDGWTSTFFDWAEPANQQLIRPLTSPTGWRFLQGRSQIEGRLVGGCVEVLEMLKGTDYWPPLSAWDGAILFLEMAEFDLNSEPLIRPQQLAWILRNYAAMGILSKLNGILLGRPYHNRYVDEYDQALIQVVRDEQGLDQLPIISGMDFGHTAPTFTLPYGCMARIDPDKQTFELLESGCEG